MAVQLWVDECRPLATDPLTGTRRSAGLVPPRARGLRAVGAPAVSAHRQVPEATYGDLELLERLLGRCPGLVGQWLDAAEQDEVRPGHLEDRLPEDAREPRVRPGAVRPRFPGTGGPFSRLSHGPDLRRRPGRVRPRGECGDEPAAG